MEQGQEGNSATAVAEPPTQSGSGQAATDDSSGTQNQNGQAASQAQSAPAEESFTNLDPKTLPPELQGTYKSMLADYTKKTQSIADAKKKAEFYDQLSRDQRFVDYWNRGPQTKPQEQKQAEEAIKKFHETVTPEEFQQAFTSPEKFLALLERAGKFTLEGSQKEINQLKAQLSVKDASDVVESFATQMKDGQLVRPDFYQMDEDGLITGYLTVNPPEEGSEKAYMGKLNEAYSWAKSMTQKYYEKGRQDALTRIQQKASQSTELPTQAAKGAYSGPEPKKLSVSEAIALAKKGIRVPRDD